MLLSALFLSLGFLFVKFGSYDYPFFWILFARYLIGSICLTAIFLVRRTLIETLRTTHFRHHLIRALVITTSQYCLFYYISKSNLLNATVLLNTGPLFIPVIDRIFLGYKFGKSTSISLVVAAIGLILILRPGGDLFEWASLFGLATGVLWAVSQIIYGFTCRKENPKTSLYYITILGMLITIPALFIFPVPFDSLPQEAYGIYGIGILLILGISTLFNQYCRGRAYGHGKPATLGMFVYFSIVFSGVFDWIFFGTIPGLLTVIGILLIILGGFLKIYLRYVFLKRRHKSVH